MDKKVSIKFHPALIQELHSDHQMLLKHIEFIRDLAEKKNFKQLSSALEVFRGEILGHVSTEILQLYVYLRNSLEKGTDQYEQMKRLRKAMDNMLYMVLEFLDKNAEISLSDLEKDPEMQESLLKDVSKIANLVTQRINVEEKVLFPMYQPA